MNELNVELQCLGNPDYVMLSIIKVICMNHEVPRSVILSTFSQVHISHISPEISVEFCTLKQLTYVKVNRQSHNNTKQGLKLFVVLCSSINSYFRNKERNKQIRTRKRH